MTNVKCKTPRRGGRVPVTAVSMHGEHTLSWFVLGFKETVWCVGKKSGPSKKELQLTKSLKKSSVYPELEENKEEMLLLRCIRKE